MYRIYVGDTGADIVPLLERAGIGGATIFETVGIWRGVLEASFVVELMDVDEATVLAAAKLLKQELKQEAVLVVRIPSRSTLI